MKKIISFFKNAINSNSSKKEEKIKNEIKNYIDAGIAFAKNVQNIIIERRWTSEYVDSFLEWSKYEKNIVELGYVPIPFESFYEKEHIDIHLIKKVIENDVVNMHSKIYKDHFFMNEIYHLNEEMKNCYSQENENIRKEYRERPGLLQNARDYKNILHKESSMEMKSYFIVPSTMSIIYNSK